MKNRKFQYVETSAKLFSRFHSYTSEDCVVCRNEQLKSALEMQCYSKSILESRPKILSLEEFFSCICSSEKIILKDLHRVFALYQVLTEEQKKRWKIRGYFDFVDIANDFFSFYQECYELTERIEEEILPWQREKFLFFQEMKSAFDIKMERENSLPKDWLFPIKYYSSQFLKKYKRILFFDIVSFPTNFIKLLEKIEEDISVEFVLQMNVKDFDEKTLSIQNCSAEFFSGNSFAYQVGNVWEESLYLLAEREKKSMYLYSSKVQEKQFHKLYPACFADPQKNTFNRSILYSFLEIQLDLLRKKEQEWKRQLDLDSFLRAIQKKAIRDYYGFWEGDAILLRKLMQEEYRYISSELLQKKEYQEILGENEEFYQKVKHFLEDLWAIEDLSSIQDLYQYFEQRIDIFRFIEEAYPDVLDVFYQVLARLSSYEKNSFFGEYENYFDGKLGVSLYRLLFSSLNRLYLKSAEEFQADKWEIRDWHFLVYEKEKNEESISVFLDVDDKALPSRSYGMTFLTENQKSRLGLQTRETEILEEKYRFFQALSCQKNLVFLIQKSEKENKTISSFLEEWLWKQGKKIEKNPYSKEFFLNSLQKSFEGSETWERQEEVFSYLPKENKELLKNGKLVLGAYDWDRLHACEKYFYFSQVLEETETKQELSFGITPRLLGILCHRFLEKVGQKEWKNFLNTGKFQVQAESLQKDFLAEVKREELRLPHFLHRYLEEIVSPKIVKNTLFFLQDIEKKYRGQKIKRFQGEKGIEKEGIYRGEDLQVFFRGRADLVIETGNSREIIDYKTGKLTEDQLDFYAYLLYGEEAIVEGRYYNIWEGKFTEGKQKTEFRKEELEEFFQNFEEQKEYHISEKKASCVYCPYRKICLREEEECQELS